MISVSIAIVYPKSANACQPRPVCSRLKGDVPALTAVGRTTGSCLACADAGGFNLGIRVRLST